MKFKKYSSIENSYRDKFIDYIKMNVDPKTTYVVTEKIHGANFSFHYNGEEFKVAKRSGFIGEDDNFFSCNEVVAKYKPEVIELYHDMLETRLLNLGDQLSVYGELYGEGIQKEVQYGEKDFVAFDIYINGQEMSTSMFTVFMLSDNVNIPTVPILGARLTLEEALAVPNDKPTKLNPIEGNIMEGTVIKPTYPITLPNGNRLVIKNKNAKFKENSKPKKVRKETSLNKTQLVLFADILYLINEQRLSNVISKIGEVSIKDFGKVLGLFMQDVFDDFYKEYDYNKEDIKDDLKLISKLYQKEGQDLVREYLLKSG